MHVSEYRDRHGKVRYRYRRKGLKDYHFKSREPGSEAFLAELDVAKQSLPPEAGVSKIIPGSFDDLCVRYYQSPRWHRLEKTSQASYRGVIERFRDRKKKGGARYGELAVAGMTTGHLDRILGGMSATPGAATVLRRRLKGLFAYAIKIGMRSDNPADHTDAFKSGKGFHTWTEEDIEAYRKRHPVGTKARLALELLLNTATRRSNFVRLARSDLRAGKFHVQHIKGGEATVVRALPETLAAIEAMPVAGIGTFLVTDYGKPFSAPGFGNWFRDRCNEAGLKHCSAHGLRKAMSRRLAEAGSTTLQGRAVTGHKTDAMFNYYAEKANREGLADDAMANLSNRKMANPKGNG